MLLMAIKMEWKCISVAVKPYSFQRKEPPHPSFGWIAALSGHAS
jgi:hypothetical protein